jgi:hypothetical protein
MFDAAAAAPGADEPPAPLGDGGLGSVPLGHLSGVGLDPVAAHLRLLTRSLGLPSFSRWLEKSGEFEKRLI